MKKQYDKQGPWSNQREHKAGEYTPPQSIIINLAKEYDNLQHRALFIITYLTAGRISEVIPTKFLRKVKYKMQIIEDEELGIKKKRLLLTKNNSPVADSVEKIEINYEGIRRKDITYAVEKGKNIMYIEMHNRKNKTIKHKIQPIPVDKETELVVMLNDYLVTLDDEEPLFDFEYRKAHRIITKSGFNPHFLRDIRLTHMGRLYDFDALRLVKFAGWTDAKPAMTYMRYNPHDLIEKY